MTATSTKKTRNLLKFTTYIWVVLLLFNCLAVYLAFDLNNAIKLERKTRKKKFEMIQLGYMLANRSDFLTAEARNFAVTAQPKHLQEYWCEVNITKNRNYAVDRLREISANPEEIALLTQSKRNSDALIFTEIRSMKLVLDAYGVPASLTPSAVAQYSLPKKDKVLSANKKLLLAQKIMFDNKYYQDKDLIMQPISEFNRILKNRIARELKRNDTFINTLINLFVLDVLVMLVLILGMIWIKRSPLE